MIKYILFSLGLVSLARAQSAGDCVCIQGASVNIRDAPCGSVVDSKSTGHCFIATGSSVVCDLDGTTYNWWEFQHGLGTAWTADDFLTTENGRCTGCASFNLVTREEWSARSPTSTTSLSTTTKYFIHHSEGPTCSNVNDCINVVQGIQNYHMDSNGWSDIGYNFLVGEDGNAYEGRGWDIQGAHASGWNAEAHGICVMGSYDSSLPNLAAQNTVQNLMECGISQGWVSNQYTLHGHRDGVCTSCPGDALYAEISTWPNFAGLLPGGCSINEVPHDEH